MYSQLISHFALDLSFYLPLFLSGLVVGSFLGMLTYRLPRGLSLSGRSRCDTCGKTIHWYHNIPLLSYLILGCKCINCKKIISSRYFFIELLTGLLYLGIGILWYSPGFHGLTVFFFKYTFGDYSILFFLALFTSFFALAIVDYETQILPDELVYISLAVVSLFIFWRNDPSLIQNILMAYIVFMFFLGLYLITKGRGMGFGDVKLSLVIGLLFSFPQIIVWFMISFLSGSIIGVILLTLGKKRMGQPIPFGPFMIFSTLVAAIWGDRIFVWYMNYLTT